MAASPIAENSGSVQPQDNWGPTDDHTMGPRGDADAPNGPTIDNPRGPENPDYPRGSSVDVSVSGSKADTAYREKQVKPNKVYVGGLPEHTRQEDLQSCFGKIGSIVNIELKVGYGFVEFDTREAAEESVAKYHEGYFMGNKIRVELSRGGGRTAKYGDPGACFKCGQMGHWARECPNHPGGGSSYRSHKSDAPLIDRIQPPSRHYPPPLSRDFLPYREDFGSGRYPPARDPRYDYPPPPPGRELRRPISPPRDYRDYPAGPPPMRAARDYDRDYRMRGPPSNRYEHPNYYPPDNDGPLGYPPRSYAPPAPPPPPREFYDRYERRPPPPDRYGPAYPPPSVRPRTPPGGAPLRARDDFDRPHTARDYPPPPEYRARPISPPSRYAGDYPPRIGSPDAVSHRYRRRSASPPPRSSGNVPYESTNYQGGSSGGGFTGSGYPGNVSGGPPPSNPPLRVGGNSRDYPPRNGRDVSEPGGAYRRT